MKKIIKFLLSSVLIILSSSSIHASRKVSQPSLNAVQNQQSIALGYLRQLYNNPEALKEFIDSLSKLTTDEAKSLFIYLKFIFFSIKVKPKPYASTTADVNQTLSQEDYITKAITYLNQLFKIKATNDKSPKPIGENDLAYSIQKLTADQAQALNNILRPILQSSAEAQKADAPVAQQKQIQSQPSASTAIPALSLTPASAPASAPTSAAPSKPQTKTAAERIAGRSGASNARPLTASARAALTRQTASAQQTASMRQPASGLSAAQSRRVQPQAQNVQKTGQERLDQPASNLPFNVNTKDLWEVVPEFVGKVIYLRVAKQGIDECGFRAVANAKAVDELLNSNAQLSTNAINLKAQPHLKTCGMKQAKTDPSQVIQMAQRLNIRSPYIFTADVDNNATAIYGGPEYDKKGDYALKAFRDITQPMTAHFFMLYKDHWVNATIVKKQGQKPVIIYMNSQNSPLTQDSNAAKALALILKAIEPSESATAEVATQRSADAKEKVQAQAQNATATAQACASTATAPQITQTLEAPPANADGPKENNELLNTMERLAKELADARANFNLMIRQGDPDQAQNFYNNFLTARKKFNDALNEDPDLAKSHNFSQNQKSFSSLWPEFSDQLEDMKQQFEDLINAQKAARAKQSAADADLARKLAANPNYLQQSASAAAAPQKKAATRPATARPQLMQESSDAIAHLDRELARLHARKKQLDDIIAAKGTLRTSSKTKDELAKVIAQIAQKNREKTQFAQMQGEVSALESLRGALGSGNARPNSAAAAPMSARGSAANLATRRPLATSAKSTSTQEQDASILAQRISLSAKIETQLLNQLPFMTPAQLAQLPNKLKNAQFLATLNKAIAMLDAALAQENDSALSKFNTLLKTFATNNPVLINPTIKRLNQVSAEQAGVEGAALVADLAFMNLEQLTVLHNLLTQILN